ncbi:MAG: OmpA family protein, partial [Gammaproteobacteria bacterium]|nr:OmpA family protein [Gammaproteobacteria bacterium]NIR49078.1 OmpA family protein [candidate division KSB1 bacterium]NIS24582.1 OmpA family protein [candidate division KSB1 bacterium]NIV69739.1 OmpA family protein [Phycisphaerae bacterium]NIY19696.1 OmpA family protein [Gammaproteobacteria bacterium]
MNRIKDLQESGRLIRIEGFSSPDGNKEENFKLSFYRAKTVADIIQAKGLSEEVT